MNNKNRNMLTYIVRIAAGIYLIYLSYSMVKDMQSAASKPWYIYLFAVIFTAVGLLLIIQSLRYLYIHRNDPDPAAEEDAEGKSGEETEVIDSTLSEEAADEDAAEEEKTPEEKAEETEETKDINERLRKLNEADGIAMDEDTQEKAEEGETK